MSDTPRKLTGTFLIEGEDGLYEVTIGAEPLPESAAAREFLSRFAPIELRVVDKCSCLLCTDEPEQN